VACYRRDFGIGATGYGKLCDRRATEVVERHIINACRNPGFPPFLHQRHASIQGVIPEAIGPYPAGSDYFANEGLSADVGSRRLATLPPWSTRRSKPTNS
jgi:hypothetical protein